jgi:hypothetical protein
MITVGVPAVPKPAPLTMITEPPLFATVDGAIEVIAGVAE